MEHEENRDGNGYLWVSETEAKCCDFCGDMKHLKNSCPFAHISHDRERIRQLAGVETVPKSGKVYMPYGLTRSSSAHLAIMETERKAEEARRQAEAARRQAAEAREHALRLQRQIALDDEKRAEKARPRYNNSRKGSTLS